MISLRSHLPTLVAGLVGAGLVLTGCSSGADDSSGDDVAGGSDDPIIGACYQLTYADLQAGYDDSQAVACATEHTTETLAAFSKDEVDSPEAARLRCMNEFGAYVGGTALVSTLQVHPVRTGSADDPGSWYRCDVFDTAGASASSDLRSSRGSAKGLLDDGVPARLAVCADELPPTTLMSCLEPHRKELLASYEPLGDPETPYPGTENLQARAHDICDDALAGRAASDDQIDPDDPGIDVEIQIPDQAGWDYGSRWAGCWLVRRDAATLPALADDTRLQPLQ